MKETGVNMMINCNELQPVGPLPKTNYLFMQNDIYVVYVVSCQPQLEISKVTCQEHFKRLGWCLKRNLKKNWHKKNSIEPTCLHTTTGVAFTFKLDFSWLKHLDCI